MGRSGSSIARPSRASRCNGQLAVVKFLLLFVFSLDPRDDHSLVVRVCLGSLVGEERYGGECRRIQRRRRRRRRRRRGGHEARIHPHLDRRRSLLLNHPRLPLRREIPSSPRNGPSFRLLFFDLIRLAFPWLRTADSGISQVLKHKNQKPLYNALQKVKEGDSLFLFFFNVFRFQSL